MVINIRRSRPDEGDKLTAIWCRSVDATHDFLTKAYRKELEEMVRAFLPEAPLWVAVNTEDQPIAFMLLTGDHMDALFVDPDVRGCGVGKLLIEHALSLTPKLTTNVNPGTYVRPHRHPHTFELLLPLRGRFVVLNFDDRGTVTHRAILG
ncbi:acetyltransferase, partial [Klebsiella pneumoniae]|uniref:acetyltransferase n=1 Tax=Klebsiella pneumoniae TaxID=573 RepID=UPI003338C71E